jgi:hypothetical protein
LRQRRAALRHELINRAAECRKIERLAERRLIPMFRRYAA